MLAKIQQTLAFMNTHTQILYMHSTMTLCFILNSFIPKWQISCTVNCDTLVSFVHQTNQLLLVGETLSYVVRLKWIAAFMVWMNCYRAISCPTQVHSSSVLFSFLQARAWQVSFNGLFQVKFIHCYFAMWCIFFSLLFLPFIKSTCSISCSSFLFLLIF